MGMVRCRLEFCHFLHLCMRYEISTHAKTMIYVRTIAFANIVVLRICNRYTASLPYQHFFKFHSPVLSQFLIAYCFILNSWTEWWRPGHEASSRHMSIREERKLSYSFLDSMGSLQLRACRGCNHCCKRGEKTVRLTFSFHILYILCYAHQCARACVFVIQWLLLTPDLAVY